MSTENAKPTSCNSSPQADQQQPACCCCAHKKWFIVLLLIVVLGAGGVWAAVQLLGGSLRASEPYRMALDKIRNDPTLKEELGQPITDAWRTAGESPEIMHFDIYGPKDKAKVEVKARRNRDKGNWDLISVEVTPEKSGQKVSVPLQGDNDAPVYHGAKPAETAKPQEEAPGPEIQINPPSGDAPG